MMDTNEPDPEFYSFNEHDNHLCLRSMNNEGYIRCSLQGRTPGNVGPRGRSSTVSTPEWHYERNQPDSDEEPPRKKLCVVVLPENVDTTANSSSDAVLLENVDSTANSSSDAVLLENVDSTANSSSDAVLLENVDSTANSSSDAVVLENVDTTGNSSYDVDGEERGQQDGSDDEAGEMSDGNIFPHHG